MRIGSKRMLLRTKILIFVATLIGVLIGATLMIFAASDNTMEAYCDISSVKEHKAVANWSSQGSPCVLTSSAWIIFGLNFFFGFGISYSFFRMLIGLVDFLSSLHEAPKK